MRWLASSVVIGNGELSNSSVCLQKTITTWSGKERELEICLNFNFQTKPIVTRCQCASCTCVYSEAVEQWHELGIMHKSMCDVTRQHLCKEHERAWCTIYCVHFLFLAGCRHTPSSGPTLWMTMLTTRTGAKLATEQPPTSEHAQRMHAMVMKFNGSGIYIVCEITFSFTKRLLMVLVDS